MIGLDLLGATDASPRERSLAVANRVNTGAWIGAFVLGAGLAIAWRAHRIAGGLLGFFLVGPVAGGGVGWLASRKDLAAAAGDRLGVGARVRGGMFLGEAPKLGTIAQANYAGSPTQVYVNWDDGSSSSMRTFDLVPA